MSATADRNRRRPYTRTEVRDCITSLELWREIRSMSTRKVVY